MKKYIEIGQRIVNGAGAGGLHLELDVFLRTRMLVQAASGQGKSHFLRRLCEQLYGLVQIFIIDHEGEFSTLRKNDAYDFVIAGEGGDTPLDLRSAGLLANRLLELNASTVFDLSESFRKHPRDRHTWVKLFLDAMMEAPKRLWHPVVVVVDEAHKFAPEQGDSEALDAMIALSTDGRKRQFCAVFATQRLGKLSKDAAAELLNIMIGGTVLDLDRKRAADALGVYGPALRPFNDEIKTIERGNFWGLGPAIAKERTLVHVGPTVTQPPRPGSNSAAAPPPTSRIKAMLPKLEDLPKEAETKAATEAELKKRIRDLEAEVRVASKVKTASFIPTPAPARAKISAEEVASIFTPIFAEHAEQYADHFNRFRERIVAAVNEPRRDLKINLTPTFRQAADVLNKTAGSDPKVSRPSDGNSIGQGKREAHPIPTPRERFREKLSEALDPVKNEAGDVVVSRKMLDIVRALYELDAAGIDAPLREAVAFWSKQSSNSSSYRKNVGNLATAGYVTYPKPATIQLTPKADELGIVVAKMTAEDAYDRGVQILSNNERQLFEPIYKAYPEKLTREELGDRAGVPITSSSVRKNIGNLRTAGLIDYPAPNEVKAAAWLFLE